MTMVAFGATTFFRSLFRGENVMPASFYLGLTNVDYTFDGTTLANLAAGEPVGNGYARQQLQRNTVDWSVDEINGFIRVQSKVVIFTASTDWDKSWTRAFICDVSAGTGGNIYGVSGPAPSPRTVLAGVGPSVNYSFWLRG